jgi:hypothetical protein
MLKAIRTAVVRGLVSSGKQSAIFHIQWSLLEHWNVELDGNQNTLPLLTADSTGKKVIALICERYMLEHWPRTGLDTLKALETEINESGHGELPI